MTLPFPLSLLALMFPSQQVPCCVQFFPCCVPFVAGQGGVSWDLRKNQKYGRYMIALRSGTLCTVQCTYMISTLKLIGMLVFKCRTEL